jgi:hypothetical protein
MWRHGKIARAIGTVARKCGLEVVMEPHAARILNFEYSAGKLRAMFPLRKTDDAKARRSRLNEILAELRKRSTSMPERMRLETEAQEIAAATPPEDKVGLRPDIAIKAADGEELIVDVAGVHSTAAGRLEENYKWALEELAAEQLAGAAGVPNALAGTMSPLARSIEQVGRIDVH